MESKTLTCQDCGKEFDFSAEEQSFFAEKGFGEPKRCKDCRNAKKNNRPEKQYTKIVCAKCGQEGEVPFVPREGGEPVLCSNCFKTERASR